MTGETVLRQSISAILKDAQTLEHAICDLLDGFPALTIGGLLAAERAELLDLSWTPGPSHRDSGYLVEMAHMLRPVMAEHGDLPLREALALIPPPNDTPRPPRS